MKWIFIIILVISTLGLNGCADTADAESSAAITPATENQQEETTTTTSGGATIWIAIVMTWNPVTYTIDKEFSTEVNCWNYYDNGAGESKMLNNYG
ncbi:uncharacterized protein METZ01_LOCUS359893, partial [marine metagenome]